MVAKEVRLLVVCLDNEDNWFKKEGTKKGVVSYDSNISKKIIDVELKKRGIRYEYLKFRNRSKEFRYVD